MRKKLIIGSLTVIVLLVIAYFAVGNYFYNFALNVQEEKEFLEDNPHLQSSNAIDVEREKAEKEKDKTFKTQTLEESYEITSNDELKLQLHANGFLQSEETAKWAIVVHGYTSKANDMTRWVRNYYEEGFHVIAPDLRGHGQSEGNYIGMGWHDRLDLLQWIDFVIAIDPNAEITLFGISMGAATVLMASGEELPPNVKVIIEDCGYSTVAGVFKYQLDDLFGLPPFPVLNAANTVTKIRAKYDLYDASAVEQIKKSTTPTLFIHGDKDSFVPFEMLNELYEATNVEKDKLIIRNAGHGEAVRVEPDVYWDKVWGFTANYIQ